MRSTRGAMQGSLNWMMTGENVIQQIEDPVYAVAATGVVTTVALASLFTAENFSTDKIGRVALFGLSAM